MSEGPITINGWSETFENADTRKRQRLGWFLNPTGNDSAGYIGLCAKGEDGLKALGVFLALCQLSATFRQTARGRFIHGDGRPMTVEHIAVLIRFDICHLHAALEILESQDVRWISGYNTPSNLPPPCQSHPGFVKGEGEGEGEGEGATRHGNGRREAWKIRKDIELYQSEIDRIKSQPRFMGETSQSGNVFLNDAGKTEAKPFMDKLKALRAELKQ